MVLRLDPRFPLLWRTPTSFQLGVDHPLIVMHDVTSAQEKIMAALITGISLTGLHMVARSAGATAEEVERTLAAVRPALPAGDDSPLPGFTIVGTGALADALAQLLPHRASGGRLRVVFADYVIGPELRRELLRADLPHLPVLQGDSAVMIGPLVEPGRGPCLYCLELHRTDADPAWPAIAAQLLGRKAGPASPLAAAEVAALVARRVIASLEGEADEPGTSIEFDLDTGARTARNWPRHPECQCAGLISVPRETATVSALRPGPSPTAPRRGAVSVAPA